MKRKIPLMSLVIIFSLLSSCDIYPYITQPTPQATSITPTALLLSATAQHTPTPTLTPVEITLTPEPTSTQTPSPYKLQVENPFYLENFNHPVKGCQWLGVAGQVFDHFGQPQLGLTVRAGRVTGETEFLETTTGLAVAYGPGGYEITLGDSPIDSSQTYWIQIFDENQMALTEKYYFDTYVDCMRNLIVLNFVAEVVNEDKALKITPSEPAYP